MVWQDRTANGDWTYNPVTDRWMLKKSITLTKGTYYIAIYNHSGTKLSYKLKTVSTKVKTSTSISLRVKKGKTLNLANILDIDGKITYKSKDKKIATVNSKGRVTGKKVGSTQIIVYSSTQKKEIIVKLKVK